MQIKRQQKHSGTVNLCQIVGGAGCGGEENSPKCSEMSAAQLERGETRDGAGEEKKAPR